MKNKTTLIVLNYNDLDSTLRFIDCTKKIDLIDKIIIVDNCSTDGSYEKLKTLKDKKIDIIKTAENKGYASGNNFGIRYAKEKYNADIVFISNPDVKITNNNVKEMVKVLNYSENVGMVTCKMVCPTNVNLPIAWDLPNYWGCVKENLHIVSKLFKNKCKFIDTQNENIKKVEVLPGSFFGIKMNTIESVDYFDEDTFLYYEENILCYKLKEKGFNNYIIESEEYIHNHSVSIDKSIKSIKKKFKINYDSKMIYCKKYLKINKMKEIIINITYKIGLFNFMLVNKFKIGAKNENR